MRVRKLLANKSELKKMEAFLTQPDAQLVRAVLSAPCLGAL